MGRALRVGCKSKTASGRRGLRTVYTIQCIVYIVHTVYTIHCTVYSVCTVCDTGYTTHCRHSVYSTLYTQSVLYILHAAYTTQWITHCTTKYPFYTTQCIAQYRTISGCTEVYCTVYTPEEKVVHCT